MTPVIEQQPQDTILTKDITNSHIVVMLHKLNGSPCILRREQYDEGLYRF